MGFSKEFKERVLGEILPPKNRSVEEVCAKFGVSSWSVQRWKRAAKDGNLPGGAARSLCELTVNSTPSCRDREGISSSSRYVLQRESPPRKADCIAA